MANSLKIIFDVNIWVSALISQRISQQIRAIIYGLPPKKNFRPSDESQKEFPSFRRKSERVSVIPTKVGIHYFAEGTGVSEMKKRGYPDHDLAYR